jgi:hypothetical protein
MEGTITSRSCRVSNACSTRLFAHREGVAVVAEKGKDRGMTGAAIGTRRFTAVRASYAVF